jgi:hypothetical protein
LLPGGAALAGLLPLAIGIAPRSRFARFVVGYFTRRQRWTLP